MSTSLQQQQQQQNRQDFWTEDVWTESDEELAQQTLQNHLEKCSINSIVNNQTQEEEEDAIAWDQFYKDHGTKFFKDRHYLEKAFPEVFLEPSQQQQNQQQQSSSSLTKPKTLVEIGCGVGNAILPLLEDELDEGDGVDNKQERRRSKWDVIHGLDISQQAITLLQQDPRFISFNERGRNISQNQEQQQQQQQQAVYGHVCDISKEIPNSCIGISDVTTLLFCLSAIDPSDMIVAAKNVVSTLKPGGILVFRDYGRYDEAQMKLGISRSKQIKNNFYRKHDGTKCYYFTLDAIRNLFSSELNMIELDYLRRIYQNKGTGQRRRRVWVQGRFQKPKES